MGAENPVGLGRKGSKRFLSCIFKIDENTSLRCEISTADKIILQFQAIRRAKNKLLLKYKLHIPAKKLIILYLSFQYKFMGCFFFKYLYLDIFRTISLIFFFLILNFKIPKLPSPLHLCRPSPPSDAVHRLPSMACRPREEEVGREEGMEETAGKEGRGGVRTDDERRGGE